MEGDQLIKESTEYYNDEEQQRRQNNWNRNLVELRFTASFLLVPCFLSCRLLRFRSLLSTGSLYAGIRPCVVFLICSLLLLLLLLLFNNRLLLLK